jgi:Spy/CpxP family protein refolding chaperone
MKIVKIIIPILGLFLSLSIVADDDDFNQEENHIHKSLEHLNLSTQQRTQIKMILKSSTKSFHEFYEKKENYEEKLKTIIQNERFDAQLYIKTKEEISKKAIALEAKILKNMHEVLTQKQRKRFTYYLKEWKFE